MAFLTKDQVFAAKDYKIEIVDVPEWNDQVPKGEKAQVGIVRMSGTAKDEWESYCRLPDGKPNFTNLRAKLVSLVVVDEKGERLFTEKEVAKLGLKSAVALDRLIEAAEKVNRISSSDYEELVKN